MNRTSIFKRKSFNLAPLFPLSFYIEPNLISLPNKDSAWYNCFGGNVIVPGWWYNCSQVDSAFNSVHNYIYHTWYQPFDKFSYPILCISTPSDVKFYLPNKDVHHRHVFNCLYLNTIETVVIDITLNFVLLQMKKKIHSGGTIGKYVCPAYGRLGVRIPGCNHEIVRVSNRKQYPRYCNFFGSLRPDRVIV